MSDQTEGSVPSEKELLMGRARMLGLTFSPNIGVDTLRDRVNAKMAELEASEGKTEGGNPGQGTSASGSAEGDEQIEEVVDTSETEDQGDFDDDIEEEEVERTEQDPAAAPNGFDAAAQIAASKVTAPPSTQLKPIQPLSGNIPEPTASGSKLGQATSVKPGKTPTLRQHLYNEQMKLVRLRIQNLDPKKSDLNGEVIAVSNKYLGTVKVFVPFGEVTDDGWHVPYIIYKELERRRFLSIRTVKDPRTKQPVVKKGWAKEFALDILPPLTEKEIKQLAVAQAAAGSIDSGNSDLL